MLIRFWRDDRAATAIEYGLLIGLIAIFVAGSFSTIGNNLAHVFLRLANNFS